MNARRARWLILAFVAVAGAIVGAVWDWYNWHPMSAIVATLVAIPLVLLGVVLLIVRARLSRQAGAVVMALGLGIVAGQILGPARPDLGYGEGTITIATDGPKVATGTGSATCSFDAAGQFAVSGDSNLRLDIFDDDPTAPADVDQREFVGISMSVGERWQDGRVSRSDDVNLWISINRVTETSETVMLAADTSTIVVEGTAREGTIRFDGLVPFTGTEYVGDPIDIAGTLTWSC